MIDPETLARLTELEKASYKSLEYVEHDGTAFQFSDTVRKHNREYFKAVLSNAPDLIATAREHAEMKALVQRLDNLCLTFCENCELHSDAYEIRMIIERLAALVKETS